MSSSTTYRPDTRPRPHLNIPQTADAANARLYRSPSTGWLPSAYTSSSQPQNTGEGQGSGYDGERTPVRRAGNDSLHPQGYSPYASYPSSSFPMPSIPTYDRAGGSYQYDRYGGGGRPASFAGGSNETSSYNLEESTFSFPEPKMHRSGSQRATSPRQPLHRSSLSDQSPAVQLARTTSQSSSYSAYTPATGRPDPYRHVSNWNHL